MKMEFITILLIAVGIILLTIIIVYNSLVRKKNRADNAFATIDVMLKKRFDLIPNLVATVKQYADYEQTVFAEITRLRSLDFENFSMSEKEAFDSVFATARDHLFMVAESYPDLKASANFMHLQRTLNETEEQLSAARRTFNASITDYNNGIQTFPGNIIAPMFGFRHKSLYHIPEHEKQVPDTKTFLNS